MTIYHKSVKVWKEGGNDPGVPQVMKENANGGSDTELKQFPHRRTQRVVLSTSKPGWINL